MRRFQSGGLLLESILPQSVLACHFLLLRLLQQCLLAGRFYPGGMLLDLYLLEDLLVCRFLLLHLLRHNWRLMHYGYFGD